jgi:hypothetical protein
LLSTVACPGGSKFGDGSTNAGFSTNETSSMECCTVRKDRGLVPTLCGWKTRLVIRKRDDSCVKAPRLAFHVSVDDWSGATRSGCGAAKFASTWASHHGKPSWKARMKTLGRRCFLVSKFAPAWTSQGGKPVIRPRRNGVSFQHHRIRNFLDILSRCGILKVVLRMPPESIWRNDVGRSSRRVAGYSGRP